jgi:transcriptional adapter 2-alpha
LKKREPPKVQINKPSQAIISSVIFLSNSERGSLTIHNVTSANKTGTNPAEIVGFMPKRRDFEVEYDNDAELLLA